MGRPFTFHLMFSLLFFRIWLILTAILLSLVPPFLSIYDSWCHHDMMETCSMAEQNQALLTASYVTVFACQITWNGGYKSSGSVRPTQTCRADAVLIVPGPLSVWQSLDQGEHLEPLEKMGQLNANKTSKTSQNMKFLNWWLYHVHPFCRHAVYFRYIYIYIFMELKEEKIFSHGIVLLLLLLLWF